VEIQNAGQHRAIRLVQRASGVGLHHHEADLFGAVTFLAAGGIHAKNPEQGIGRPVEHPDEWGHEARENHERRCNGPGCFLRACQGDGLGGEFSQDNMKKGEQEERDRHCRYMARCRRRVQARAAQ